MRFPAFVINAVLFSEQTEHILKGEENHKAEEQHIAAEVNARFDLLVDGLAANGFDDHENETAAIQTGDVPAAIRKIVIKVPMDACLGTGKD